jgi:hypothetical protein
MFDELRTMADRHAELHADRARLQAELEQARRPWWRRGMNARQPLADLMADPGELDITCLDCHHNTTMPVATLLPRYGAETLFPEVWGGFRCSACGSGMSTFSPTGRLAKRQGR